MKRITIILSFFIFYSCTRNEKTEANFFIIKDSLINKKYEHFALNSQGDIIKKLDYGKYSYVFSDTVKTFFIAAPTQSKKYGMWVAVDLNENFLFEIHNTQVDFPSPDRINFGLIRIVDKNKQIGFANDNGKIIIKPQFEEVTAFYKDYAIIGRECKNIPLNEKQHEGDCSHHERVCKEYGYIDKKGKIIEIGVHSRPELWKMLEFPNIYD